MHLFIFATFPMELTNHIHAHIDLDIFSRSDNKRNLVFIIWNLNVPLPHSKRTVLSYSVHNSYLI